MAQSWRASVIIPNFNGARHLPDCLDAVTRQTFAEFETVVVDNGSTDGSVELLKQRYPAVRTIRLPTNGGFPAAANEGIVATRSPYVVLLNNDTKAADDWLERLVGAMEEVPEAGFGASKLVRYDDPLTLDAAGDTFVPSTLSGVGIGTGEVASRYDTRSWVFGACAAAAIYRRAMLDDIGLFDEGFFLTHEDVDLSMRAQMAGYRCMYVPDAVVAHKRRTTYRLDSPEIEAIGLRNRLWVVGKNTPGPLLARWAVLSMPHVVAMSARKIRHGRSELTGWSTQRLTPAISATIWEALRALPAKRRSVRHLRRGWSRALLHVIRRPHEPVRPR